MLLRRTLIALIASATAAVSLAAAVRVGVLSRPVAITELM